MASANTPRHQHKGRIFQVHIKASIILWWTPKGFLRTVYTFEVKKNLANNMITLFGRLEHLQG
jgi:hypothetical protein